MDDLVLYDKTGDIRDVNTVLVPLDKLRELQAEAARYRWLRDEGVPELCVVSMARQPLYDSDLDRIIDTRIAVSALQESRDV